MKKIILLLAAMLFSSVALSSMRLGAPQTNLSTASYQTQKQAAEAGEAMMANLQAMPSQELLKVLPIYDDNVDSKSVRISQIRRSVKPVAEPSGQIEFQSILTVNYRYQYYPHDD
ncbi:DUF3316 domain-containing protein [Vibrio fluvialis]|uniref:DUF3316 domain-containing protein n=1 Tax=Vibrio fluvialis TaxID=676 RepID=UPI0005099C7A|nr:DUF3316 domain-containing protein [Vibrio fluvialis]AVH34608.1 DUF3316 domain-containing protein [Vibrio fluvialis]EKO3410339.1 DUF3316 domain-containing protein [Vibrio fluvialis]EKO3485214.1 DUF3316 domain-containing protein [Vibrio fluvialis]EKO3495116.1 DUF3316 domain-containing protein [Vibrio fluvialis]EKO3906700.1 DUF3316 domain-containing protein [Vibrio fluvialis]